MYDMRLREKTGLPANSPGKLLDPFNREQALPGIFSGLSLAESRFTKEFLRLAGCRHQIDVSLPGGFVPPG